MARLAELPRIIGVKDATGDLSRPWTERQLIKNRLSGYRVKMQLPLLIISVAVPVVFQ
jgi:hypothetical protein